MFDVIEHLDDILFMQGVNQFPSKKVVNSSLQHLIWFLIPKYGKIIIG